MTVDVFVFVFYGNMTEYSKNIYQLSSVQLSSVQCCAYSKLGGTLYDVSVDGWVTIDKAAALPTFVVKRCRQFACALL